nr:hypothetical protein A132_14635 [Vibrio kanaloae 5S-149]
MQCLLRLEGEPFPCLRNRTWCNVPPIKPEDAKLKPRAYPQANCLRVFLEVPDDHKRVKILPMKVLGKVSQVFH